MSNVVLRKKKLKSLQNLFINTNIIIIHDFFCDFFFHSTIVLHNGIKFPFI